MHHNPIILPARRSFTRKRECLPKANVAKDNKKNFSRFFVIAILTPFHSIIAMQPDTPPKQHQINIRYNKQFCLKNTYHKLKKMRQKKQAPIKKELIEMNPLLPDDCWSEILRFIISPGNDGTFLIESFFTLRPVCKGFKNRVDNHPCFCEHMNAPPRSSKIPNSLHYLLNRKPNREFTINLQNKTAVTNFINHPLFEKFVTKNNLKIFMLLNKGEDIECLKNYLEKSKLYLKPTTHLKIFYKDNRWKLTIERDNEKTV